jgi:hypothetical protein
MQRQAFSKFRSSAAKKPHPNLKKSISYLYFLITATKGFDSGTVLVKISLIVYLMSLHGDKQLQALSYPSILAL